MMALAVKSSERPETLERYLPRELSTKAFAIPRILLLNQAMKTHCGNQQKLVTSCLQSSMNLHGTWKRISPLCRCFQSCRSEQLTSNEAIFTFVVNQTNFEVYFRRETQQRSTATTGTARRKALECLVYDPRVGWFVSARHAFERDRGLLRERRAMRILLILDIFGQDWQFFFGTSKFWLLNASLRAITAIQSSFWRSYASKILFRKLWQKAAEKSEKTRRCYHEKKNWNTSRICMSSLRWSGQCSLQSEPITSTRLEVFDQSHPLDYY